MDNILPLRIENLGYRAGNQLLLKDISLDFNHGPITIIMGHNGAGKSLLLKLCHGLLEPSEGVISWNGLPPAKALHAQAMVFQRPVMLRRSVLANLEYPLKLKHINRKDRHARAMAALEKSGLGNIASRMAPLLSGGEQQKLALARAWALMPQVLFLDEPTASLDPRSTAEVENLIRAIHASGTKIIMTSHQDAQAKRLADEVIFLHEGRMVETGPAQDVLVSPRSIEARAYLAGELPV